MKKYELQSIAQLLIWTAMVLIPTAGHAECTEDSDCAEGEICESAPSSVGECYIDEDGEEVCTEEEAESLGYCMEAPIDCEQDSDCPSHLRCENVDGQNGDVSVSGSATSGGSTPAPSPDGQKEREADPYPEEPEDEESMMCVYIQTECEVDTDCIENFRCEIYTYSVGCAEPAEVPCEEGEDCEPLEDTGPTGCEEEEVTEGFCEPIDIECDSDNACPSDWRCKEFVEYECDSDDFVTNEAEMGPVPPIEEGPMGTEGEEDTDEDNLVEDVLPSEDCEETRRSMCVPVGLEYESFGMDSNDRSTSTEGSEPSRDPLNDDGEDDPASVNEGGEDDSDDGGTPTPAGEGTDDMSASDDVEDSSCRSSSGRTSPLMLIGLLMVLGLRRRMSLAS